MRPKWGLISAYMQYKYDVVMVVGAEEGCLLRIPTAFFAAISFSDGEPYGSNRSSSNKGIFKLYRFEADRKPHQPAFCNINCLSRNWQEACHLCWATMPLSSKQGTVSSLSLYGHQYVTAYTDHVKRAYDKSISSFIWTETSTKA